MNAGTGENDLPPNRLDELHAFLVRFSDAVRRLEDTTSISRMACRFVAEELHAERAYWAEVDWDTRDYVIGADYHAPGATTVSGRFPLEDWEPFTSYHLQGRPVVVEDVDTDSRISPSMRAGYAALGIAADLAVPVLASGRLRCTLAINQGSARTWRDDDVALVRAIADRCWAEVERARAEKALRASEDKYRTLFESIDEGFCVLEILYDEAGEARDCRYVQVNPAFLKQTGQGDPTGKLGSEYAPASAPAWLATYDAVVRSGAPVRFEQYHPDSGRWYSVYASIIGERGSRLVANVFADVTERKRAEAALRESEERQAFLLRLSDALRAEPDADAVANRAIRILLEELRLDRCYITFYRPEDDEADLPYQVGNDSVPPLPSKVRLSDFADAYEQVLDRTFVIEDDFKRRGLTEAERANSRALGMRAMVGSTVRRGAKNPLCSVAAVSARPRRWTPGEITLVEEAAERTWAAMERARAETALRESEAQYRLLFEGIDDGFCSIEVLFDKCGQPYDYRFLKVNPAFERQTGLVDAVGKRMMSMRPEHEPFWVETYGRIVQTQRHEKFEHRADALGRWYEVKAAPIGKPGENQVAIVFRDVLQKRKAEQALRESEEKYRNLFESMDEAYAVVDVLKDEDGAWVDFRFVEVNPAFIEHTSMPWPVGKTATELLGTPNPRWTQLYRQALDTGEAIRVEEAEPTLDRVFDLNIFALDQARNRVAVLFTNITERKRAEAALRESEERFRQFAAASAAGLWIRDADSLSMEFVSSAIGPIYGVEPEDLLGDVKRWATMIVPEDRERAIEHLEQARRGETTVHEFRIQRPADGAFRWIRNTDFPLRDDGGIPRIGGIAEDVTEAKLAVEHQSVLLAELQHRVRNIMAMLRSITRRSADGTAEVDEYQTLLEGRLLALARVQALLTRQANTGGSLRDIVESEVSAQAHGGGQFELAGPDLQLSPKAVEVLTLALHELATNALKYGALSVPEGRLRVEWAPFEKRGRTWLAIDWVETGAPPCGPATRRGFGSDLIEGKIPYELGGTGRITIEPGGARCHLEFPLKDGESILETDAPSPTTIFGGTLDMTGAPDLTGRSVLVVEDDYYLAGDTAAALRGAGATVLGPCPSEDATLDLLETATPTHAVLDLNLGGGGPRFEIAHALKERGVPFLFLTGYDPDAVPVDLVDVVRLQKPASFSSIVEAVAQL